MGYLTTHVLDTARGLPAAGIKIQLYKIAGETRHKLAEMVTNSDGRTDAPILPEANFAPGTYELVFLTGAYLEAQGDMQGERKFLDEIPLRFGINDQEAHYHVPLLLSPYGYSTYRGS
jgi:5-hydroxyisourate hydrolase